MDKKVRKLKHQNIYEEFVRFAVTPKKYRKKGLKTDTEFAQKHGISRKTLWEWKNMEQYFPQPRPNCLMRNLSFQIISDTFPIPPTQSKKLIPHYKENTPLPIVYEKLRKYNKNNIHLALLKQSFFHGRPYHAETAKQADP